MLNKFVRIVALVVSTLFMVYLFGAVLDFIIKYADLGNQGAAGVALVLLPFEFIVLGLLTCWQMDGICKTDDKPRSGTRSSADQW